MFGRAPTEGSTPTEGDTCIRMGAPTEGDATTAADASLGNNTGNAQAYRLASRGNKQTGDTSKRRAATEHEGAAGMHIKATIMVAATMISDATVTSKCAITRYEPATTGSTDGVSLQQTKVGAGRTPPSYSRAQAIR